MDHGHLTNLGVGSRAAPMGFIPAGPELQKKIDQDILAKRGGASADDKDMGPQFKDNLNGHIRKAFHEAQDHKATEVTERLLKCLRNRKGQYSPTILAKIEAAGGSKALLNITETKCTAAEAWMHEILIPAQDKPWGLQPTPVPDLPDELKDSVADNVAQEFAQVAPELLATATMDDVAAVTQQIKRETERKINDEVTRRTKRMETLIEDQFAEGNFRIVMQEFLQDLATFPLAIIKGPVFKKKKRMTYKNGEITIIEEIVPTFERVSPFDLFPAPHARSVQDAYLIELKEFSASQLENMKGTPGWSDETIEKLLLAHYTGSGSTEDELISGNSERRDLETKPQSLKASQTAGNFQVIEYWGPMLGKHLAELGLQLSEKDHAKVFEINAIIADEHVLYAVLNPDKLGERPYFATSFEKIPGSLWGKGIPEKIEDLQDASSAMYRSIINNFAIASGPQVMIDQHSLCAGQKTKELAPWQIWYYDSTRAGMSGSRKPIDFFQPQLILGEAISFLELNEREADDRTMIPRYQYGNQELSGAGETASGLSMLLSASSKGIKRVLLFVDQDVISPLVRRMYRWNMQFSNDPEIKADAQVVPRGIIAIIVKEQTQMRRNEFLANTNNDVDMQIIGLSGRATLLRESANDLDLPVDEVVPAKHIVEEMVQQLSAEPQEELEPDAVSV